MSSSPVYPPFNWRALRPAPVVGIDEVGVGCLAGPVYAAAVVLQSDDGVDELRDSKRLTALQRDRLFDLIGTHHLVGLGRATVKEIERYNVLLASLIAMRRAVRELELRGGHLLVDGRYKISKLSAFRQTTLVKADERAEPVMAASIIAKVARDRYMERLARRYKQYGFEANKGYGTAAHRSAIVEFGSCRHHRASYLEGLCGSPAEPDS